MSFARDREDQNFQQHLVEAAELAERAKFLASANGVPSEGPAALLRRDPLTQGPLLFKRHCANCHPYLDGEGNGIEATTPAAPNLHGFPNREWIAGLFDPDRIASPDYYGHTAFVKEGTSGGMIDYVRDELYAVDDEALAKRKDEVRKIVLALAAEANLPAHAAEDKKNAAAIAEGRELISGETLGDETTGCASCHQFGEAGSRGSAPDLTGYGSREWLDAFISNPSHERFYGDNNDGMPAFVPAEPGSPQNMMSHDDLLLIVDWLRQDWPRQ